MNNDLSTIKQTYHVDNVKSVDYSDEDYYVYVHFRNDTGEPFYVGKGKKKRAFYAGSKRSEWWNHIVNKHGHTVKVIKNFYSDEKASLEFETETISMLREIGFQLCNQTDGGEGASGYKWTEEQKFTASEKQKIAQNRQEVKSKKSESGKIAQNRPENKVKLSGLNNPNYAKSGARSHLFSGYAVGVNDKQFIILAGKQEIRFHKFDTGAISKCILGRNGATQHKGFKWTRQQKINPDDFIGLEPYDELSAERLKK